MSAAWCHPNALKQMSFVRKVPPSLPQNPHRVKKSTSGSFYQQLADSNVECFPPGVKLQFTHLEKEAHFRRGLEFTGHLCGWGKRRQAQLCLQRHRDVSLHWDKLWCGSSREGPIWASAFVALIVDPLCCPSLNEDYTIINSSWTLSCVVPLTKDLTYLTLLKCLLTLGITIAACLFDIEREQDDGVEHATGMEPELGDSGPDPQTKAPSGKLRHVLRR